MIAALLLALAPLGWPRTYHAWLDVPGGELAFGLELRPSEGNGWSAFLLNGEERIAVPHVEYDGKTLLLDLPHYDSRIRAQVVAGIERLVKQADGTTKPMRVLSTGDSLEGTWEKRRTADSTATLPFFAVEPVGEPAFDHSKPAATSAAGRWLVDFETDDEPAVAVFGAAPAAYKSRNGLRGTFLTATGDYRYLAGTESASGLVLSCFDGAHAFLFTAGIQPDGTLAGDFWSGNWHHETWTAKRDDAATLADPFAATRWNGMTRLADLAFPDLAGKTRSLGDFAGKATLLVVFGSWCPNCNDEALFLKELDAKYRDRGLNILGLAFELTGEFARDAKQVQIFAERHGLTIPFFLCGTADKDEATKALKLVDKVRAFPTTLFVGADGRVRAVHSGYAGPATGEEHAKLRAEFERRIEELLAGAGQEPR